MKSWDPVLGVYWRDGLPLPGPIAERVQEWKVRLHHDPDAVLEVN
jgi:hypothetical protein